VCLDVRQLTSSMHVGTLRRAPGAVRSFVWKSTPSVHMRLQVPGVQTVFDLHVWALKPSIPLLAAHVTVQSGIVLCSLTWSELTCFLCFGYLTYEPCWNL
jgi:hypothetical protein